MRSIYSGVAVVLCVLVAVPRVDAQSAHAASQAMLDAAVQQQASAVDRDRETVRGFLQRSDVKAIAGKAGIDLGRAETAVAAMDASDLVSLAAQARQAEQTLAGGQSKITISTTTIIIGLLVLIVLIVALK
jgi:hypothetical protein